MGSGMPWMASRSVIEDSFQKNRLLTSEVLAHAFYIAAPAASVISCPIGVAALPSMPLKPVAPLKSLALQPANADPLQRGAPAAYHPTPSTSGLMAAPPPYRPNLPSRPPLQHATSPLAHPIARRITAPIIYGPTPPVQKKRAGMIPAPPLYKPSPLVIQRAAGPTIIDDVFEDVRVPSVRSVDNLRHWVRAASVTSQIAYAERTPMLGSGSRWEIGITFFIHQASRRTTIWIWHVHAEGNAAGRITSVSSAHFKKGHSRYAGNFSESGYAESVRLLADLYAAHGNSWTKGHEVDLNF